MTHRIPDMIEQQRRGPSGIVASLAPSAAFLVANNWFGLVAGMVAATILSAGLIVIRRARGQAIGWLLPVSLGYVIVRGIAGVLTGSENVFFGFGVATSALIATAVGVTAFTRHPLAGYLMPLVVRYEHLSMDHPVYRRVAAQITLVWAVAEMGLTTWEAWHLSNVSGSEFLVDRTLVGWPVMGLVIFMLIFYVRFRLDPHEHHLEAHARMA